MKSLRILGLNVRRLRASFRPSASKPERVGQREIKLGPQSFLTLEQCITVS